MFKYRKSNPTNMFDLEIENFVTKLSGTSKEIWESILRVRVDYGRREIAFDVIDLEGGLTERFFDEIEQDPQLLVRLKVRRRDHETIDYCKRFHGVKMIERTVEFDYALQEPAAHHVRMSYESAETETINTDVN